MPYDQSLDNKLFSESSEFGETKVTISVYSYNNGPKKLQISRENKDTNENFRFTKLGRITKDEVEALLPLIQKALLAM